MKKKIFFIILGVALLFLGAFLFFQTERVRFMYPSFGAFEVIFLDIGQGDATYIRFGNKEDMLVDCGKDTAVVEALGRHMWYFDRTITTLVVTHPDRDHYGGCVDVLKRFKVKRIIMNGDNKLGDTFFQYFLELVKEEQAEVIIRTTTGTESIAGVTLVWLYPDHDLGKSVNVPGSQKETGSNNGSIVFRLDTGKTPRLLMTGDMEFPLEEYLLEKDSQALQAEVLKVGHHGSGGSTSDRFMDAVQPSHGVISVGIDNSYGHPSERVVSRLKRYKTAIWRTDLKSDIMALFDQDTLHIHARR